MQLADRLVSSGLIVVIDTVVDGVSRPAPIDAYACHCVSHLIYVGISTSKTQWLRSNVGNIT